MTEENQTRPAPGQAQIKSRRWNISLVWIVPIVAMLIGLSLVVNNILQAGPTITITFKTGEGLTAHKTQVKYRSVVIGEVSAVELSGDKKYVTATVKLSKEADSFASKDSLFWVVRPRIGAGGVSGVDTLLSGNFIGADAGQSPVKAKAFTGLESPPPITYGEQGKTFILHTKDLGSLDVGSPVYYRKIPVGQVVSYALDAQGKGVDVGVFVQSPNDKYVTVNTRFWNASGIDVGVSANGLTVNTESLSALLIGGIAFLDPDDTAEGALAAENQRFDLFVDQQTALTPPNGRAQHLRLRFDQALRGLAVNAPVEFMGIEMGNVTAINLDFDEKTRSFPIMVDAVIYPGRLGSAQQKMLSALHHSPDDEAAVTRLIGSFVENGLRAQARTGNLLTGQLYISLDFYPDAEKVAFDPSERPIQVPTVPGSLDKIQEQLQQMVDKINNLPLERIAGNLDGNLAELRQTLKQFNSQTLPGVQGTLEEIRSTLQSANSALGEDSPQREQLSETLNELGRVSRSLRDLTDYLGRHPESLIRGRPDNATPRNLQP
ncbi:MlaD family protein [Pseudomonas sp. LS44]|uniref:PqiB family protein n=1 Tax=Pseudomonas sp. LS44 TaxID=1357074 RepID=UPI00215A8725|nr:MlaD family protein [Pseudomonas sp. LS44]UVE17312.1 MlaD family protein [Pseudomonas sp. LS44]